ncbi:MAG: transposase [Thermodesulfovibrionales bacterium]
MARKPRIEFEGAFYHVITRGNQRRKIFRDEGDFEKYIEILSRYKAMYKCRLYAYVLMSNHVHLLIETGKTPLSKILQGINQSYTGLFNRKYKTVGHLFQGRYKAILCDRDDYLLSLVKYIHLNPVRARLVETPEEYTWSSHRAYIKPVSKSIIDEDQVLRMFSGSKGIARRLYEAYVGDGIGVKKEDISATIDKRILGNEQFANTVMDKCDASVEPGKRAREHSLVAVAAAVSDIFGVTLTQMRHKGKDRDITKGRKLFSIVAHEYGYKGREIAEYMRKDPALITRHVKESKKLEKDTAEVIAMLKVKKSNVNSQV